MSMATKYERDIIRVAVSQGLKLLGIDATGKHKTLVLKTPDGREAKFDISHGANGCGDPRIMKNVRSQMRRLVRGECQA
jgi:hypothetical protein